MVWKLRGKNKFAGVAITPPTRFSTLEWKSIKKASWFDSLTILFAERFSYYPVKKKMNVIIIMKSTFFYNLIKFLIIGIIIINYSSNVFNEKELLKFFWLYNKTSLSSNKKKKELLKFFKFHFLYVLIVFFFLCFICKPKNKSYWNPMRAILLLFEI